MTLDNWEYPPGSKIREKEAYRMSMGGEELPLSEYWVDRCLLDIETGTRFYYVKPADEAGSGHFYSASAIEGQYEVVGELGP